MADESTTLQRKRGLYLKDAGIKGRGIFCSNAIKKGEVLEVTPGLILHERATKHINKTLLVDYAFTIGKISKAAREHLKIGSTADSCAMIMGLMTFCNHDKRPNAEIVWEEKGGTVYYTLKATRNIPKDTEICTTYGASWFSDRE